MVDSSLWFFLKSKRSFAELLIGDVGLHTISMVKVLGFFLYGYLNGVSFLQWIFPFLLSIGVFVQFLATV